MEELAVLQTTLREPPYLLAGVVLSSDEEVKISLPEPIEALEVSLLIRFMCPRGWRVNGLLAHVVRLVGGNLNTCQLPILLHTSVSPLQ